MRPLVEARLRLHRPAAAVLHRGRQGEGLPQGRRRQGRVPRRAPEPQEGVPAAQGPRRDGLGGAERHHDGRRRRARCCRSTSRRPPLADEIMSVLMGDDVELRKHFIQHQRPRRAVPRLLSDVDTTDPPDDGDDRRRRRSVGCRSQPIELQDEMERSLPRLRHVGHHVAGPARRARRPQAGAPPDHLGHGGAGLPARPPVREVRPRHRRHDGQATTRTATARSTTPSCAWPSRSRCATR